MPSRRGGGSGGPKGFTAGNSNDSNNNKSNAPTSSSSTAAASKPNVVADSTAPTHSNSTAGTKFLPLSAPLGSSNSGNAKADAGGAVAGSAKVPPKSAGAATVSPVSHNNNTAPGASCANGAAAESGVGSGGHARRAAKTTGKRSSSGTRRTGGAAAASNSVANNNDEVQHSARATTTTTSSHDDRVENDEEEDLGTVEYDDEDDDVEDAVVVDADDADAGSNSDNHYSKDACLHCRKATPNPTADHVQVRCDECSSYICNDCHWCHEFQANHEIRVCDRCDAFYCKGCDEMDQCDDCGEVVCGGCSTLLSCKFCGGGLCEDCATACGRCGIVLCSRDAKFAVDCDTCRLSYCLVCLASGSKDPCVRCGHRPSKRMEQLVHLRLKSIYKAFKQTSHSSSGRGGGGSSSQHGGGNNGSAPTNTSTSTNLRERQNDDPDEPHVAENPEVLLQHAAASAAAKLKQATSAASSGHHSSASSHHPNASSSSAQQPSRSSSSSFLTMSSTERLELFMAEKAKADQAAADLLAELDEEEELKKKSTKMSKKQKKKLKQQQGQQPQEKSAAEGGDSSGAGRGRDEATNDHADNDESSSSRHVDRRAPRSPRRAVRDHNEEDEEQDAISREGAAAVQGEPESALEPIEVELETLIESEDIDGIEALLSSVKGVPGLAVLRKNAKKALKRFRVDQGDEAEAAPINSAEDAKPDTVSGVRNAGSSKLRKSSTSGSENPNRVEWSMRVDPSIVGYVIGKGGLRIRDLMEESGARIWVDQEGLGPNEQRMVCCSGYKKNVDVAIKLIIDVVERAPTALVHSKVGNAVGQGGGKVAGDASKFPGEGPASSDRVSPSAAHRDPSKASHVLTCDPRFVPLLIGRRGWTIKNIQDSSGARVDIDQSVSPRRITISGSEGSVEVAARMVRDVLSYPHSQLQGATESEKDDEEDAHPSPIVTALAAAPQPEIEQELNILEQDIQCPEPTRLSDAVARGANSPPSSLIMTGDAKSTVSASSSLSSTPEPSMASSLPKGGYAQVPPGPMLPPAYGASQHTPVCSDPSPRDVQTNAYLLPQESSFDLPIAPPMTNHSAINLAAMQSVPPPQLQGVLLTGSLVSSGPHVQGPTPFAQAPVGIAGPPATSHMAPAHLPVGAYRTELHQGPVAPFTQDSVMNEHANLNLTGPLAGQTGRWNGSGAQSSLQLPSSSDAVVDSFRFDAAVEFLQNTKTAPSSFQLVGGHPSRISASLPQRDTPLLGLPVGQEQVAPGYLSSSNPAHVDSQIVDSLFGPTPGPASDESLLLNGLQGLSLNKDYTQLGLWGAPTQAVDEKGLLGLGSYLTNDVRGSPTDLNVGDAPALNIHHPSQSRFGW